MNKLVLTSLLAVFAVSSASAAINDNPLYRPDAGKFVSTTMVKSHTEHTTYAGLEQKFAYGVTDKLSVNVDTELSEVNWFDTSAWDSLSVGANYRVLDGNMWKVDVFGGYGVESIYSHTHVGDFSYTEKFLDKDMTVYDWTVGAQAGYTSGNLTLAGHVTFDYRGNESFNWDDEGMHRLRAGVTGFLELNHNWGLLASAEYEKILDNDIDDNRGSWTGIFGVNYNINDDMFVAGYVAKEMTHTDVSGKWEIEDGFGFGAKFGIQF